MKKWFENKGNQYRTRKPQDVSEKTKNLFWLNVKSGLYKWAGIFLLSISLFTFFFNWFVALILIGVGIFLLIKGHQQKLQYKLSSGYIVYRG